MDTLKSSRMIDPTKRAVSIRVAMLNGKGPLNGSQVTLPFSIKCTRTALGKEKK